MVKKLKTKFFKLKPSFFISIAFLILGGIFIAPIPAKAAITPNSLNINLSNNNPSIGENISAVISVKQEELAKVSNKANSTFAAIVWNTTTDSVKNLTSVVSVGTGLSASNPLVIAIKSPQFVVGKNHLKFSIAYNSVYVIEDFQSELDIEVKAGSTTGVATLNLSSSVSYSASNTRTAKVDINFNAGASGRSATTFDYDCGNGKTGSVTTTTFNCDYPVEVKDYVVKVSAKDSAGVIVSASPYTVSVTNNDISGSVNRGEKDGSNPILALINQIIGIILGFLQELVYGLFYWLIAPLIQAMLSIHVYTDTFVAVIYPGWEVIRNICNIFFIVALMVIALATLFRVDSYQTRPLLIQLILAALMINFSLVIAQAILALADTIQAQFLPANVTVIRSLAGDLMVGTYRDLYGTKAFADASFAGIIKPLFFLAMSLGSFMVFAAIAVFLVIRIVALWLLLLISPIAYACGVLPSTAQYRKTWWDNFLKYAFFTPIMAFFLNLTAVISNQFKDIPILQTVADKALVNDLGNSDLAGFVFKVASNLLLLVFLIAALQVADKAGVYGASGITKIAQNGIFAPFGAVGGVGKLAGGFAGRKWNQWTSKLRGDPNQRVTLGRAVAFAALNPVAWVKGMKYQSEERVHRAQAEAEAVGKEVAEQRFSNLLSPKAYIKGSYKINPHVFQHAKHDEDEQSKNLANLTLQEVVKRAYEIALMDDDQEGRAYKRGVIKLTMSKGHIDDITENMHTTEEGKEMMKKFDDMIKKGWFNKEDVFEGRINATTGAFEYTETDDQGIEHVVSENERRVITQNDMSRRAMYVAMFGGEMHKGYQNKNTGVKKHHLGAGDNPADYAEYLEFHLADHEADRLITQEGESEGLAGGHLEYMDMKYDPSAGHYESYALRKEDEVINGVPTGRKIWVNTGSAEKQAVEIAKRNPREQMHHLAPHSLMSSDGKSYYLATWKKVSTGVAEAPQHIPDRLADRLIVGWRPTNFVDRIRKDFQEEHENIVNLYGPTMRSTLGTTGKPTSAVMKIKLNDDDRFRLEAFAAENRRGVAGLFQKFLKTDGALQNTLTDGKYEIVVESPDGSLHPLHLKA